MAIFILKASTLTKLKADILRVTPMKFDLAWMLLLYHQINNKGYENDKDHITGSRASGFFI
jgi:hypothetical protein